MPQDPTPAPEVVPEVVPVAPAPVDGTVSADFGNGNVLKGLTILCGNSFGPDGEEVNAFLPVDGGYVQLSIPSRYLVK